MSDPAAMAGDLPSDEFEDAPPGPWDGLRVAAPALLLGIAAWGLLFRHEIAAAVQVWFDSTAYSHCFFVLPIALYLVWDRREVLPGLMPKPLPWVAVLVLPMGLAWFGAERLGITEGRQLVAITMLEALFLAVLGWRFFRALSAPLLYLYFLVPFGGFLTLPLQRLTAWFTAVGLDLSGIPHYIDAFQIEIPEGSFYVAEACAGLRFLIASVAFGVLYSCLIYRTPWKRLVFMAASIVIPIIANGFRALGIVLLGHFLGSAEAAATDHVLYGWLFFSVVIVLLILAGMPFREDETPRPPAEPDPEPLEEGLGPALRPLRVAVLAALLAAAGPATAALLDTEAGPAAPVAAPRFATPPGCTASAPDAAPGTDFTRTVECGAVTLKVNVHVFPPRVNPNRIVVVTRTFTGEDTASDTQTGSIALPGRVPDRWRLVTTEDPGRVSASALWIDAVPRQGGIADRAIQARHSILGAASAPVVVAVSYDAGKEIVAPKERDLAEAVIRAFVGAQTDLNRQIVALSEAAARPVR